jgi:hypothetical protein
MSEVQVLLELQVNVDNGRRRSVKQATPVGESQGKLDMPGPHMAQ